MKSKSSLPWAPWRWAIWAAFLLLCPPPVLGQPAPEQPPAVQGSGGEEQPEGGGEAGGEEDPPGDPPEKAKAGGPARTPPDPGTVRVEVVEEEEQPRPPAGDPGAPAGKGPARPAAEQAASPGASIGSRSAPWEQEPEADGQVVISATRTQQTVEEAPSIITVITREDILALGYRSLTEVLRNTVGYEVNDNGHWPDTGVRGINDRTTYGDKIQMLLDGHDMSWRQFNRNYHNPSWVQVEDIARIEVIRGPGAAVWGANALNGVVNIVTRDWAALDGAEFTLGMDHLLDHQFISGRAGTTFGDHLAVGASVAYYHDDADALLAPLLEFERLYKREVQVAGDAETGVTAALRARYRWITLSFHKSRFDTGAPLSTFSVLGGDDSRFVSDRHIVRLAFEKMLLTGLELSAEAEYDDYRFDEGTVYESDPEDKAKRALTKMAAVDQRWEMRMRLSYVPTLNLQALAGLELEYLDIVRWYFPEVWAAEGLPGTERDNLHFGGFLQAQYSPWSVLGITAGIRLDYDQIYGFVPTPRAGLVLRLPVGITLKGLFGMAYKAPSFHDLYYYRKDAYYGNPALDPEQSLTGELQVGYRYPGWVDLRVTGFYTRVNDLIVYASRAAGTPLTGQDDFLASQRPSGAYSQKINEDHVSSAGVEAELTLTPHQRVRLDLQGTYRYPWDSRGERLPYSAQWTAGGALRVRVHHHLQVTLRGLGVGSKETPARAFTQQGWGCPSVTKGSGSAATTVEECWTNDTDPTRSAPAYFVGTLVLRAMELLHEGISLHLKLDNFTATRWYDAGREVLYPQRGFQGMLWATVRM